MKRYLFGFGYVTPRQRRNSTAYGYDDEDSQAFIILAADPDAAEAWGRTLAQEFVRTLYGDLAEDWAASGFASWIAETQETELPDAPIVTVGARPDYEDLIESRYGPRGRDAR